MRCGYVVTWRQLRLFSHHATGSHWPRQQNGWRGHPTNGFPVFVGFEVGIIKRGWWRLRTRNACIWCVCPLLPPRCHCQGRWHRGGGRWNCGQTHQMPKLRDPVACKIFWSWTKWKSKVTMLFLSPKRNHTSSMSHSKVWHDDIQKESTSPCYRKLYRRTEVL